MSRSSLRRLAAVATAGIIAVTAFAAIQDISLKRKPKVGDVSVYKTSATFTTEQGDVIFAQNRQDKVTEVKPDGGFVVESSTTETKITFAGNDIGPQPDTKSALEFGPEGLPRTAGTGDPAEANGFRIANLHAFKAPDGSVKVGDEIKFDIPADTKKKTPAMTATYKVVGNEKVKDWDTVKLTFTAEEKEGDTKASIKGTVWLSSADGSMVKVDETWKDVQPPTAPFPVSGNYKIERVK